MTDNLVIYHKDCFDGICAAWVVDKYFKMRGLECDIFPATYGQMPPDCEGKNVYIVDFSYPRPLLERVASVCKTITVLDHHKTAEEDLKGLDYAIFNMNKSGAGIAWDWFFPGARRPWLVDTIEDRDLWRHALPDTQELMAYISTVPMTIEAYEDLSNQHVPEVAYQGKGILKYITNYGAKAIEHVRHEMIGNYLVATMNISYQNCSEHLNQLIEKIHPAFFVASYFRRADGLWQFSLRSEGAFDVSMIAKIYGGGGHRNAAGFTISKLPWED